MPITIPEALLDAPPEAFMPLASAVASRSAVPAGFDGDSEAKRRGLNWPLKYGPALAGLGDAYTTRQNIRHGASEWNPAMRPFAGNDALYGVETGLGLAAGLGGDALAKHGHRTLGTLLAGSVLVPMASGAVLNLIRAHERSR